MACPAVLLLLWLYAAQSALTTSQLRSRLVPLCSLNHSMIHRVVLSCASVASRSPLPLLCMAMSSALGSQLRAWWCCSVASKYAAPRCDREWAASAPASWSEAGYSGDVAVMGRRPAWWPPGLALGAPLSADDGRERWAVKCSRALS